MKQNECPANLIDSKIVKMSFPSCKISQDGAKSRNDSRSLVLWLSEQQAVERRDRARGGGARTKVTDGRGKGLRGGLVFSAFG